MKVSLIVPFIDTWDITQRCVEKIVDNTTEPIELVMIDNGSTGNYTKQLGKLTDNGLIELKVTRNKLNNGVLSTYKQGLTRSTGDIICFIHSDVLLQESGWSQRVREAFTSNPSLGLAGLFGAVGVGTNGGRIRSQSNMKGYEWGKCECHAEAWQHHSEYMDSVSPATILDGVGMFFSRQALQALVESDMFDGWRAMHHFYDRIMPLKLIDKGYKIATIGIGFDHWSGATANSSKKYVEVAEEWLDKNGYLDNGEAADKRIYDIAEHQFFKEFGDRLPCTVDSNWNYQWGGVR